MPALNSSPATPYFGTCPIDFTAVTPGLAAPHKKVVETHASQARAILSNLKNTIAEDSDDKAARERKRCASIVKTIKKVKGERVKNQAYESKKFQDCIAWLNVQEKDIGELQEKINKERARHDNWSATQKVHAEKAHKKVQKDVTDWLIGLK